MGGRLAMLVAGGLRGGEVNREVKKDAARSGVCVGPFCVLSEPVELCLEVVA
jgi:hypothetical protein